MRSDMTDSGQRLPMIQDSTSETDPPIFNTIAIVGLGLIGGSIALAARARWPTGLVIGVDEKDVLEKAMVRHAIDVAADDPVVIADADLVILAAPVKENLKILCDLHSYVRGSAIVTDVGSTKTSIVECASTLPPRLIFVGGHPLGGAPRGGIDFARSDLFVGRPWLFTPASDAVGGVVERLDQFVTAHGAKAHVMSPVEHDRVLAFISHLPQLTASALMHVVGEEVGDDGLALTGRGLADTTRLASSPSVIWQDICATNSEEIGSALERLIVVLQRVREGLEAGDPVKEVFDSASAWRAVLAERVPRD